MRRFLPGSLGTNSTSELVPIVTTDYQLCTEYLSSSNPFAEKGFLVVQKFLFGFIKVSSLL